MISKITTRKTPNGRHQYRATCKGYGTYGWGDTPDQAREKLRENTAAEDADRRDHIKVLAIMKGDK